MKEYTLSTDARCMVTDITQSVREYVCEAGITDGVVTVFVPHTTAGVIINENGDPDVQRDILFGLERMVPNAGFRHFERNSDAHLKSVLAGSSVSVIVSGGILMLGTWQSVYFCEFDGPRNRKYWIAG